MSCPGSEVASTWKVYWVAPAPDIDSTYWKESNSLFTSKVTWLVTVHACDCLKSAWTLDTALKIHCIIKKRRSPTPWRTEVLNLVSCLCIKNRFDPFSWGLQGAHLRIKKTRILVRSVRAEAFRTIQYLIPAGSENVRMVRKLQNFMKNQKLKELRCTQNQIDAMMKSTSLIKTQINKKNHQGELLKVIRFWWGILKLGCTGRKKSF